MMHSISGDPVNRGTVNRGFTVYLYNVHCGVGGGDSYSGPSPGTTTVCCQNKFLKNQAAR